MKLASAFQVPLTDPSICYLYVSCTSGTVRQIDEDITPQQAYDNVKNFYGRIIAIWKQNDKCESYLVDNIDEYGNYFNCNEKLPITIIGAERQNTQYDTPRFKRVNIYFVTERPFLNVEPNFDERFEDLIKEQFGWQLSKQYKRKIYKLSDDTYQMTMLVKHDPNSFRTADARYLLDDWLLPRSIGNIPNYAKW